MFAPPWPHIKIECLLDWSVQESWMKIQGEEELLKLVKSKPDCKCHWVWRCVIFMFNKFWIILQLLFKPLCLVPMLKSGWKQYKKSLMLSQRMEPRCLFQFKVVIGNSLRLACGLFVPMMTSLFWSISPLRWIADPVPKPPFFLLANLVT